MLNVLFVCHGNICRSPMAEFIFKKMVKDAGKEGEYYIESAAVSAEDLGSPIYPPAKRCLTSHGIPFDSSKCARLVTRADYNRFDRIIIMDSQNRRWLSRIIPDDPEGKVQLMMSFCGINRDVADPWYTGDFEASYRDITAGCKAFLEQQKSR